MDTQTCFFTSLYNSDVCYTKIKVLKINVNHKVYNFGTHNLFENVFLFFAKFKQLQIKITNI